MKKITMNLLAVGVLATGLLASCSSENTTGVEGNETNTENTQSDMGGGTTSDMGGGTIDTSGGMQQDTTNQNPPTDNTGNQDQQ